VTDNVGLILQAMVSYCIFTMHRDNLELAREKEIISKDEQYGGKDGISHNSNDQC
jgi:hypothetical protein